MGYLAGADYFPESSFILRSRISPLIAHLPPLSYRSIIFDNVTMGIHTLGKTDIPTTKVDWIEIVKSCKHPVPFDVANLMFNVQWCFALECHKGDFTNVLAKLKQFFAFFKSSGLNLFYVLDGKGNPHKAPEDLPRQQKRAAAEALLELATKEDKCGVPTAEKYHALRGCVSNTSLFIALVYRLLKSMELLAGGCAAHNKLRSRLCMV